jgi:choline dehydrogenase-like flavoprotein
MGIDDGTVVDGELRLHGPDGCGWSDASLTPRITRRHPHAPTVVIAERAAELIRAGCVRRERRTGQEQISAQRTARRVDL